MNWWLKYGFCKKTEITSNAKTNETKASIEDTEVAETVQPQTSNPQKKIYFLRFCVNIFEKT